MTTFKLSIWYAASRDDAPQVETLDSETVYNYIRPETGFLSDMLTLGGAGVRRLCLEVQNDEPVESVIPLDVQQRLENANVGTGFDLPTQGESFSHVRVVQVGDKLVRIDQKTTVTVHEKP